MKIVIEINPPENNSTPFLAAAVATLIPLAPRIVEGLRDLLGGGSQECPECAVASATRDQRLRDALAHLRRQEAERAAAESEAEST